MKTERLRRFRRSEDKEFLKELADLYWGTAFHRSCFKEKALALAHANSSLLRRIVRDLVDVPVAERPGVHLLFPILSTADSKEPPFRCLLKGLKESTECKMAYDLRKSTTEPSNEDIVQLLHSWREPLRYFHKRDLIRHPCYWPDLPSKAQDKVQEIEDGCQKLVLLPEGQMRCELEGRLSVQDVWPVLVEPILDLEREVREFQNESKDQAQPDLVLEKGKAFRIDLGRTTLYYGDDDITGRLHSSTLWFLIELATRRQQGHLLLPLRVKFHEGKPPTASNARKMLAKELGPAIARALVECDRRHGYRLNCDVEVRGEHRLRSYSYGTMSDFPAAPAEDDAQESDESNPGN